MIKKYYWEPDPRIIAVLKEYTKNKKLIVDLGPHTRPLAFATEYIDIVKPKELDDRSIFKKVDITKEKLPYKDKEVDFLYARHILEDIYNPIEVCQEIQRVAKAGYIETPSPVAEFCRYVNGKQCNFRGYDHHRYFVWVYNGILTFLPKLPIIEHSFYNEFDLFNLLNQGHLHWNTYYFWVGSISFSMIDLLGDVETHFKYIPAVYKAIQESIQTNNNITLLNPPRVEYDNQLFDKEL